MVAPTQIKLDELFINFITSDSNYSEILNLIERGTSPSSSSAPSTPHKLSTSEHSIHSKHSLEDRTVEIPKFYEKGHGGTRQSNIPESQSYESMKPTIEAAFGLGAPSGGGELELGDFVKVVKEICNFPTFFNQALMNRIHALYPSSNADTNTIDFAKFSKFWQDEMATYDQYDRFFRLIKQPEKEFITKEDFAPFIKELLNYHPGLEFLSSHAEFQDKYAATVITRIFYVVNTSRDGRITARQIRKSNLLHAFQTVDEEDDINKVTQYFSYEHFYVLYCRFWELDQDRDYKITREDLIRYGDHALSHLIVDRIFDAAPRPFVDSMTSTNDNTTESKKLMRREYLTYEDFIFFMLSEEDKANEVSVRYWFSCIDVFGEGRLNIMEMRSFYAIQLHRMQCLGHEIVPFEDMLCQMMDMIKPKNTTFLCVDDFLQTECRQVSGALFDALFNLNKYLQFEQRDPFMERQKREDEFDCDWDRFACVDYSRLALEEEAREEDAMEIDWVTVDDEDDDGDEFMHGALGGASEAPF